MEMKTVESRTIFIVISFNFNLLNIDSQKLRNLVKESGCQCGRCKRCGFSAWVGKIPWSRKWHPTPEFLPGNFHGQGSLVGYSPWGCKELDD